MCIMYQELVMGGIEEDTLMIKEEFCLPLILIHMKQKEMEKEADKLKSLPCLSPAWCRISLARSDNHVTVTGKV